MKLSRIIHMLEQIAPPSLAEDWDNVGLLAGQADAEVRKILVCVDATADVLAEALSEKAQAIVTHHPVIFRKLSRVTPQAAPVAFEAVRRGVAIYCMHTNFDAAPGGTNDVLAEAMGLTHTSPLRGSVDRGAVKIVTFAPGDDLARVADAAFSAGAGRIGHYRDCAFFSHGIGGFCGEAGTHPAVGRAGRHEVAEEVRLEVVAPASKAGAVCSAIRAAHSYETPAIDVYPLVNSPEGAGLGRVGNLARPLTVPSLIARVKRATGVPSVLAAGRPGAGGGKKANIVSRAACCAGTGREFWRDALQAGATFYLTGEMGHHDALDAAQAGLTVVTLGHGNSERIAMRRLAAVLAGAADGVKFAFAKADRDPMEPA